MPTFKTRFGIVDEAGLDDLRDSFDTTAILRAIDAVDQARGQLEAMRENLLTLHGVAMEIINDAVTDEPDDGSLDVHDLVEEIDSAAFDTTEAMETVQGTTHELEKLGSDEVWDVRDAEYNET